MSENIVSMHGNPDLDSTIRFADKLAGSDTFKSLFREGMALVEETASYLDTEGREESKDLNRSGSLTYATESMRLTTRLMQLASWLLLQRAVNDGEMSQDQAKLEKNRVRIDNIRVSDDGQGWDELPDRLKILVEKSINLQRRIVHLDNALDTSKGDVQESTPNPIASQLDALSSAFMGNPEPLLERE